MTVIDNAEQEPSPISQKWGRIGMVGIMLFSHAAGQRFVDDVATGTAEITNISVLDWTAGPPAWLVLYLERAWNTSLHNSQDTFPSAPVVVNPVATITMAD
jgi:hypothetical protein